jgi:predicted dehydrogenase
MKQEISRRDFTGGILKATALTILPRETLGGRSHNPPSERLNIACIGTGGQGIYDMKRFLRNPGAQVIAVCDVSEETDYSEFYYGGMGGREPARRLVEDYYAEKNNLSVYKGCEGYRDFSEMLDKRDDIDAVAVATPDHIHAVAAMAAIKRRKHVYCEKPLTRTVREARELAEATRKYEVVTQMGHQLHASNALKILVEMLKSGVIGKIREVHLWASASYGGTMKRPQETPPVPNTLDWDLWLGPAPYRPYHPAYVPFKWRSWWDFGTGALGDFGCHIMDPAFWALELTGPMTVEARSSKFSSEAYPAAAVVKYEFGARGELPPLTLTWYDGGLQPWRPAEMEGDNQLPGSGGLYVGDQGKILARHGGGARLIPESKMSDFQVPKPFLPRGPDHYQEWVRGCKGGPMPLSHFGYAGPLTEMVLLGNVAIRTGKKLMWDGPSMSITDLPEANEYLHRPYREGWSL